MYSIPQNHVLLIQRFGKYNRTQKSGLRSRFPFFEKRKYLKEWNGVATKKDCFIELSEQQTDTQPRQCQTRDNVTITADAAIYWRILDPVKAVYEVDILPKSVADISLNALRSQIGKMSLNDVLSERQQLNQLIIAELKQTSESWGIEFIRVDVQEIDYSKDIHDAMLKEMVAERESKAAVLASKSTALVEVAEAESQAKAIEIKARAEAKALKIIANSELEYISMLKGEFGEDSVKELILAQKYLKGLRVISNNPSNKIFIPDSLTNISIKTES